MSEYLLEVEDLKVHFPVGRGLRRGKAVLKAVDGVSFRLRAGETLGIVGESGCGKSTCGNSIIRLIQPTGGQVLFEGRDLAKLSQKELRGLRRDIQMIFQDPFSSLNPRFCVSELIAEPLKVFQAVRDKKELDRTVEELMDTVGLARRLALSYPHELDGGRRQRIGIARALALNPRFIVCDEPVSALDVSIQAQILNLLQDLQEEKGLTYLFVTHDLSVVKHISDEIMVMYLGCLVEKCSSRELFRHPLHPYTKGLLSAIPVPSIDRKRKRIIMTGEIASPIDPRPCCRFAGRCPYARDRCREEAPEIREPVPGHLVACHRAEEINPEFGGGGTP